MNYFFSQEILEDFLFPASRLVLHLRQVGTDQPRDEREINPLCQCPTAVSAAFELLITMTTGCYHNMNVLSTMLIEMYYSGKCSSFYLVNNELRFLFKNFYLFVFL